MSEEPDAPFVAVVIPCFKVKKQIGDVIAAIGPEVKRIYLVDDACPEQTGAWVEESCTDPRVRVLRHERNEGVGGAMISGYRRAIADGAEVIVKLDGDGQMNPKLIPRFIRPILAGEADYTKGNRFFELAGLRQMPAVRIQGNAVLSFVSKISTGYWDIFDPTNGYTAIHARVAELVSWDKLSRGYFFESDLLFRLNTLRAVVVEIPIRATYRDEVSSLRIRKIVFEFAFKHAVNSVKRILYNYYLRGFSIASVQLLLSLAFLLFGTAYGVYFWYVSWKTGQPASSGTVMVAGLPVIIGAQLGLAFLSYDMQSMPRVVLHKRL